MAVAKEARWKVEDEANHLTDERVSLLLELRTCKDEVSAMQVEALKEKEALREAYQEGFDAILNYGYGCYAFTHNICRSQPEVPDGMLDTSKLLSPEFFINPRCPPGIVPIEATFINVHPSKATNALEREALAVVLETDNSEVGKHLSIVEVGQGNEPDSSARITEEINERDVSGEN